jgi:hypothetical protein
MPTDKDFYALVQRVEKLEAESVAVREALDTIIQLQDYRQLPAFVTKTLSTAYYKLNTCR